MALVHILNRQTDEIINTLSLKNAEFWGAIRKDSLENENAFDFTINASSDKSGLLEKRNRLLIDDEDGFFREYVIIYAEQNKRNQKDVKANASFTDLAKSKIIEPQTLQGATPATAVDMALLGTEWQPGDIEYTSIQTIVIEDYTNPLALLKTIASTFELEISYRVAINGNKIVGRYVDMKKQIAGFEGKEIVFGKDLVGVKRKEDSSQIVTALLGVGPEKEDGTRLTVLVEDSDAFQRWGRNGQHLIEPFEPSSTDSKMTIEQLEALTKAELKKRIDAIVTYECDAVSLEHIKGFSHEKIRVGQTVLIKDDGYQPPLYLEARLQEVEVDQATHRIQSIKIGNFIEYKKSDLEAQIAGLKKIINDKISKMVLCSISSSAGTVFKNNSGSTTLTAKVYLAGQETDLDGSKYSYKWSKYDKDGNLVSSYSKTTKYITVTSSEIAEKATFEVEISTDQVTSAAQITLTVLTDGQSLYTWVKYADDINGTGISDDPTNKKYIGFAYNKPIPIESSNADDYTWNVIEGSQGVPGTSYYTWLKYADTPTSGMSDYPTGKTYMGLAMNKTTPTESTNYADYTWSLIKGDPGDAAPVQALTWSTANVTVDKQGRLWKSGGTSGTWTDAQAYTTEAYTGGAYLSFKVAQTNKAVMFGLNTDPATDANYTGLDYCFYIRADATFESRLNGANLINHGSYVAGDVFSIVYDNLTVKYYKNGTLLRTLSVSSGLSLAVDSSFSSTATSYEIYDIYFLPSAAQSPAYYTWIKYADDANGTNMSDDASGKTYMGIAYNKTTAVESTTASDYTWSLIQGPPGSNATSYWLIVNVPAIGKNTSGVYTPASITVTGMTQIGTGAPSAYPGRFIIAETTDGTTFTDKYTSAANESTKAYTPSAGIKALRVRLYLAGGTSTLIDEQTIPIVSDGSSGSNAITGVLSNESATVPADSSGNVTSFTTAVTTMNIYNGASNDSANWTVTAGTPSGLSGTLSGKTFTVSSMSSDSGYVDLTATRAGYSSVTKRFTVTKSIAGSPGAPGATGPRGPEGDESTLFTKNSNFYDWGSGVNPTNWYSSGSSYFSKVASDRSSGNLVSFNLTADGLNSYVYQRTDQTTNAAYGKYIYLESTFKLTSGSIDGSGIYIRFYKSDGTYNSVSYTYKSLLGYEPTLNKWYTIYKIIPLPSAITEANFSYYQVYAMGAWTGFTTEPPLAKTFLIDSCKLRFATDMEIYGYLTGDVLDSWKGSALNGVTYINGGLIQTNTILVNRLAVGDFTNLVHVDEKTGVTVADDIILGGYVKKGVSTYTNLQLSNMTPCPLVTGDKLYCKGTVISPTASTGRFNIRYYDDTKTFISSQSGTNKTINTTDTNVIDTITLTIPAGTCYYYLVWLDSGTTKYDQGIKNVVIRKMHAGEMIVDGSITATKLNVEKLDAISAQMGDVTLGGSSNGNGTLTVLNADGEVIANLDAGKGGFDSLYVGELTSPSIVNYNAANYNIYVDPVNGDDDNDGLTTSTQKKTLQNAIDSIPKFNDGTVGIILATFTTMTESVEIKGFVGGGDIVLNFGGNTRQLNGTFDIRGNSNQIQINDITINASLGTAVDCYGNQYVRCTNVIINNKSGGIGWYSAYGTNLYLVNCEGYNGSYVVLCRSLGRAYLENCTGKATSYGVAAEYGGTLYTNGTIPTGTTGNVLTRWGGSLIGTYTAGTGATTPPTAPTQTTTTITASSGDNWSALYGSWSGDGVKQGNYGYGNRTGIWIFNTTPYEAMGNVAGKTIKGMKVWIKRKSSGGASGKVRHSIRYHNYATKPATAPTLSAEMCSISLGWGESGWVSIPSTYWSAFSGNTAKGIGLYTSDGSNYSVCEATGCKVEITYQ